MILDKAAAGSDLFDIARQVIRVIATATTHVLLDAMTLAVVEKLRLAGVTTLRILPGGEPSLGVVGEQRARLAAPHAGSGAGRRAAHHITAGDVADSLTHAAAGGGVQVGAIAEGERAQCAPGDAVEGVIAVGRGILGAGERACCNGCVGARWCAR